MLHVGIARLEIIFKQYNIHVPMFNEIIDSMLLCICSVIDHSKNKKVADKPLDECVTDVVLEYTV